MEFGHLQGSKPVAANLRKPLIGCCSLKSAWRLTPRHFPPLNHHLDFHHYHHHPPPPHSSPPNASALPFVHPELRCQSCTTQADRLFRQYYPLIALFRQSLDHPPFPCPSASNSSRCVARALSSRLSKRFELPPDEHGRQVNLPAWENNREESQRDNGSWRLRRGQVCKSAPS